MQTGPLLGTYLVNAAAVLHLGGGDPKRNTCTRCFQVALIALAKHQWLRGCSADTSRAPLLQREHLNSLGWVGELHWATSRV